MEGMYIEILREVVNSCRGLGRTPILQTIVMDFEKAAINAARSVLGGGGGGGGATILQVATAVCGNGFKNLG